MTALSQKNQIKQTKDNLFDIQNFIFPSLFISLEKAIKVSIWIYLQRIPNIYSSFLNFA